MGRTMPRQKPGESEQDVATPRDFLDAVEKRFGRIGLDLAADSNNHVCPLWLGPGSPLMGGEDALAPNVSWAGRDLRWLNPRFANLKLWAQKSAEQRHHAFIAMLSPAIVSTNIFDEFIHRKALVLGIRPRLIFVGQTDPYPKDLILSVYGPLVCPGFDTWKWK